MAFGPKKPKRTEPEAPRVVQATATMSGAGGAGTSVGRRAQDAMVAATEQALAEGVTDPAEILRRKLAARAAILG